MSRKSGRSRKFIQLCGCSNYFWQELYIIATYQEALFYLVAGMAIFKNPEKMINKYFTCLALNFHKKFINYLVHFELLI